MPNADVLARRAFQMVFRSRRALRGQIRTFVEPLRGAHILELGSGKPVKGSYPYSSADLVHSSNHVVMSDLKPEFGHRVINITTMDIREEFDAILCANVLEHVYETASALQKLHRALKPEGALFVSVPVFFPLHDEPHDYWRFTEHALRRMLSDFVDVRIDHRGPRRAPLAYYVQARSPTLR